VSYLFFLCDELLTTVEYNGEAFIVEIKFVVFCKISVTVASCHKENKLFKMEIPNEYAHWLAHWKLDRYFPSIEQLAL
jgi:hypothetical protein